jgi:2-(3-amino-3-carboxypropyl)histidine synthase
MSDPTCCQKQNGECASCAPVTKPKKKFVGKRKTKTEATVSDGIKKFKAIQIGTQIPDEILNNEELQRQVQTLLPRNYNFEIYKTLARIHQLRAHRVALQLPEGLLMYATTIADLLTVWSRRIASALRAEETAEGTEEGAQWQGVEDVIIMGDVTYGACCIDDYSCQALECALLVHYGHSCLVPTTHTTLPVLYVFVDILIDLEHFIQTVRLNFTPETRLLLISTIQFSQALHQSHQQLKTHFPHLTVPQARPLSGGEILGCTSPAVASGDYDALIYLGDGRFHLESIMIANPTLPAYRYDPYSKLFTIEKYDFPLMKKIRRYFLRKMLFPD